MTDLQFLPIPPKATPDATNAAPAKRAPELTTGETWLLYLTVAILLAVGTLGLLASFQSVSAAAALWGFETPQLLPISIDLAIPGFTIANLLLIRMDMELAWVHLVPWTLTYVTVYLNIQAGTTLPAKIGHGALPLVWVICSEIAGHVYRSKIGAITGKRMEKIRRIRWILAPISTMAIWRRMNLWEETSYRIALTRQRDRLLSRAGLRETHGWNWRWTAPRRDRVLLRLGDLNPADALPGETRASAETETPAIETETTETRPRYTRNAETETAPGSSASETETTETAPTAAAATGETETDSVYRPAPRRRETAAPKVSTLRDRDPEAEVQVLLGLMRDRQSETAIGLKDAIRETGRPKATAAKRLKVARDRYRQETAA